MKSSYTIESLQHIKDEDVIRIPIYIESPVCKSRILKFLYKASKKLKLTWLSIKLLKYIEAPIEIKFPKELGLEEEKTFTLNLVPGWNFKSIAYSEWENYKEP